MTADARASTIRFAILAGLGAALAIAAMTMTDTLHPPTGFNPLLVAANGLSWAILITRVLAAALLLLAFAWT